MDQQITRTNARELGHFQTFDVEQVEFVVAVLEIDAMGVEVKTIHERVNVCMSFKVDERRFVEGRFAVQKARSGQRRGVFFQLEQLLLRRHMCIVHRAHDFRPRCSTSVRERVLRAARTGGQQCDAIDVAVVVGAFYVTSAGASNEQALDTPGGGPLGLPGPDTIR